MPVTIDRREDRCPVDGRPDLEQVTCRQCGCWWYSDEREAHSPGCLVAVIDDLREQLDMAVSSIETAGLAAVRRGKLLRQSLRLLELAEARHINATASWRAHAEQLIADAKDELK